MFGHSSINCRRKPRCLICSDFHSTVVCPTRIPRNRLEAMDPSQIDRTHIKCANCGLNHTANFRGCSTRVKYKEIIQRRTKNRVSLTSNFNLNRSSFPGLPNFNNIEQRPSQPVQLTHQGATFSSIVQEGHQPNIRSIQQQDLFSPSELMNIWKEMVTNLHGCTTKIEQLLKLGEITMKYLYTASV